MCVCKWTRLLSISTGNKYGQQLDFGVYQKKELGKLKSPPEESDGEIQIEKLKSKFNLWLIFIPNQRNEEIDMHSHLLSFFEASS